jgi:hypothetical protein
MSASFFKTCLKFSLGLIFMLFLQSISAQTDFSQLEKIIKQNEKSYQLRWVTAVNGLRLPW